DEKQLEDKFINAEKIITMISVLKNQFNLCIIDLPIDAASEYSSILAHVDAFGLCVKNSLYSVLNTARSMDFWLNNEYRKMVAAKSKIIITEYNDKIIYHGENFTPNKTIELLKAVSTDFMMAGAPVGYVPYTEEFSGQIETEVSLVDSNAKMKEAYKKILIRILEGVG
ncbi:MAG: hypothetical protein IJN39_02465, partial [Clostridia bacterium]|nr:hypothetical protein [Clostridia bacterium]